MNRPSARSRSTIGTDPFAAVIPTTEPHPEPDRSPPPQSRPSLDSHPASADSTRSAPPRAQAAAAEPAEQPDPPRQKLTVHLDGAVVNRVKNAAYWNPRLTIAKIAERGIRLALREVEKEHGGPYPQRDGDLVGGRPIK